MLTITRQTDYACRVILHLALQGDGSRLTAAEIGKRGLIPKAFVRRVVTQLAAAGLIVTTRGNEGGIALARPASEISLLAVVEAFEGPLALNACTVNPGVCPLIPTCTVHDVWFEARRALRNHLGTTTFADLARGKEV